MRCAKTHRHEFVQLLKFKSISPYSVSFLRSNCFSVTLTIVTGIFKSQIRMKRNMTSRIFLFSSSDAPVELKLGVNVQIRKQHVDILIWFGSIGFQSCDNTEQCNWADVIVNQKKYQTDFLLKWNMYRLCHYLWMAV